MPKRAWTKLPTRLLILAAAGLAVAGLAACEAKPDASGSKGDTVRKVTVVGSGEVQGTPDTGTINASIVFQAPDAVTATNQTNEKMGQVIDAVKAQGVKPEDISTVQVEVSPQYGDNSAITGYQATNSISVKLRDINASGPTVAAIQTTGGNNARINSVNFSIDDASKLVKDARSKAFADAKARADQYAQLSGSTLGQVLSISETGGDSTPPPTPMPRALEAASAPPLQPGQQTVSFSVTVVWELT
jgi:uncharacterized protein